MCTTMISTDNEQGDFDRHTFNDGRSEENGAVNQGTLNILIGDQNIGLTHGNGRDVDCNVRTADLALHADDVQARDKGDIGPLGNVLGSGQFDGCACHGW